MEGPARPTAVHTLTMAFLRTIAALPLAGLFVWIAAANWVSLVWQFTRPNGPSWTPFLAGLLGIAAIFVAPFETLRQWWWVLLFLDAGCVPGFAVLASWHFLRARGRRR
jgi:hypothetical protein